MEVSTIGLDLAKNVFQVHGVFGDGTTAFNRSLRRAQVLAFFQSQPPCLVGIEACGTSHYWAREIAKYGHEVRLIPPAYVKPYVKRGKSDAIDAAAICESVTRPSMRFVAVKAPEQQAVLALHRVRDLIVRQRTQIVNMLRGVCWPSSGSSSGKVPAMRSLSPSDASKKGKTPFRMSQGMWWPTSATSSWPCTGGYCGTGGV